MNKKGFTLIELLAVIVILAIIAIIVTPVVTGIITKTKLSADMRSAEGYVKAAEDYFANAQINEDKKSKIGTNISSEIEVSGKKPDGDLIVNDKGQVSMAVIINNKCFIKEYETNEIIINDNIDSCNISVIPPDRCFATENVEGGVNITKYLCGDSAVTIDTKAATYNNDGEFLSIIIPSKIGDNYVLSIGKNSFTPVTVGDKVGVKSIKMLNGTLAGYSINKNEIESLVLSHDLITMPSYAIMYNMNLKNVFIPNSVTSVKSYSVTSNNINSITFEPGTSDVTISRSAFVSNQLKNVSLSDNIISIGSSAFRNNLLESINLPNKLTQLSENVFFNNLLSSIDFKNVNTIGNLALSQNRFTSITLPSTIKSIGNGVFNGNLFDDEHAFFYAQTDTNGNGILEESEKDKTVLVGYAGTKKDNVTIPSTVTKVGDYAFDYAGINNITIPNSITSVGYYSFANNNLSSIVIPNSIKELPFYSFAYNNLTNVEFSNNIEIIGESSFSYNKLLENINIPNSVTTMEYNVFYNDDSLKNINIDNTKDSISGSPWRAPSTANINWLR